MQVDFLQGNKSSVSKKYRVKNIIVVAVVEWLEQLGYGAENRRIAGVRGSSAPCGDWKTLSVNPAENVPFSN